MSEILILANNDIGLYKFRKDLIQKLINKGNSVFISLPNGEYINSLVELNCKFINTNIDRRGLNPIKDIRLLIKYFQIIKKIKPDFVITYTIKPNIYGGIICCLLKIKYAINITGLGTAFQSNNLLKKVITFLYKVSCKRADVIFFENTENKDYFIKNKIIRKAQAYKLNGAGVNLEDYQYNEYPNDNGEIRFLFIGRIMKEKGIIELFEVAKMIHNTYKNVFFDIVGPYEDNYIEIINKLSAENIIKYYGYQSDIRPFIISSHCLILASYHEGMANTLLEAGAMGRPLITSNICGCKEAVIDGKTGFLVEPNDCMDLYSKVVEFINIPYSLKKIMGRHSYKHIKNNFEKSIIVNETIIKMKI
jgi:Glycosyltransferase